MAIVVIETTGWKLVDWVKERHKLDWTDLD